MKNNLASRFYFLFVFISGISVAQTVTIGNQTWMTRNLDVCTFRNGDTIPEIKDLREWNLAIDERRPAWCYYNNDSSNGTKYGKLYNWHAVNDPRGLAPVGYHIPSDKEWTILTDYLGIDATSKMKSEPIFEIVVTYNEVEGYYETKWVPCNNCSYWTEKQRANNPCTVCRNKGGKSIKTGKYIPKTKTKIENKFNRGWNGTNESGFNALPSGLRGRYETFFSTEGFQDLLVEAHWWSTTLDYGNVLSLELTSGPSVTRTYGNNYGKSVRCIKDTAE